MALNPQEQAELDSLNKELGTSAGSSSGLSAGEQAELDSLNKDLGYAHPSMGQKALGLLGSIGKKVDSYTGAPTRAAIGAAQDYSTKGVNPLTAFGNQFGQDPAKAPTGQDIVARAGISNEPSSVMTAKQHEAFDKANNPGDYQLRRDSKTWPYADTRLESPAEYLGKFVDVAADPVNLIPLAGEAKGLLSGTKVAEAAPKAGLLESIGKGLYKSGVKNLDLETQAVGKAPVSDLLIQNRITGNSQQIFDQMQALGDKLLTQRNAILRGATRAGAEVDMQKAVAQAQDFVDQLKKVDNPESRDAVNLLQSRIHDYTSAAAKEPEQVLRTLPYRKDSVEMVRQPPALAYEAPNEKMAVSSPAYEASGTQSKTIGSQPTTQLMSEVPKKFEQRLKGRMSSVDSVPVIQESAGRQAFPGEANFSTGESPGLMRDRVVELPVGSREQAVSRPATATVLDETERIPGPTPMQTTAWKSTAANRVGDKGFEQLARLPMSKEFDKSLASGLREATEESVGKSLGPESRADLSQMNAQLGQILESNPKAYQELEKEARKMGFSSVDGMLLFHPQILATKKFADLTKTSKFRTVAGLGLMDLGKALPSASDTGLGLLRGSNLNTDELDQNQTPGLLRLSRAANKVR